jgi:hypothetical protein
VLEHGLTDWLTHFDKNPEDRFVSDGDPATVTVPATSRDRLRANLPKTLKVIER